MNPVIGYLKKILPNFVYRFAFKLRERKRKKTENRTYFGDAVLCVICHSSFRCFAPTGSPVRLNARCPNCGSLERHRLLWLYFNEKKTFTNSSRTALLHFAPEKCFYDFFSKANHIDYFPVDLFPEYYKYLGKKPVVKTDITNIPFKNELFDFVLCNHVLEHIPDDQRAMAELFRVMNKGSKGIFQVPIDNQREATFEDFSIVSPDERAKYFGQSDHVRLYGRDYRKRLEKAGFFVHIDDFVNNFSEEEITKYGLMKGEMIYLVEKI